MPWDDTKQMQCQQVQISQTEHACALQHAEGNTGGRALTCQHWLSASRCSHGSLQEWPLEPALPCEKLQTDSSSAFKQHPMLLPLHISGLDMPTSSC